jgi:hypothetical protein
MELGKYWGEVLLRGSPRIVQFPLLIFPAILFVAPPVVRRYARSERRQRWNRILHEGNDA